MTDKTIGGAASDDNYQRNNDKESIYIEDQVQVYYVGFCDQEELCDTLNDIIQTIDFNKDISSYIFFSCSDSYLENLPQCFNDLFLMQNLNLLQERGTEIYYEMNPQGFLDMIKKFPNSVCMVTIYGHGSNINPSIHLSKNCGNNQERPCQENEILNAISINNSLQYSENLFIFLFFSCYATKLVEGLLSQNILAIIPKKCSKHDIPTLRRELPNNIIGDYDNLSYSLENTYFEIGESKNQTNYKKNYFDNKLNGFVISYNFGHPQLIYHSDEEYDYGSDAGDFDDEQDGGEKRITYRKRLKFTRRSKKKKRKKTNNKIKKKKKTKKNKKRKYKKVRV
jgi:hypothetical protein